MNLCDRLHQAAQIPGLSQTAKGVLMALTVHSDKDGWSCPSVGTIQEYCSLKSPRSIPGAFEQLQKQGIIEVQRREGQLSWYRLCQEKWPDRRAARRVPPIQDQGLVGAMGETPDRRSGEPLNVDQGVKVATPDRRSETPDRRSAEVCVKVFKEVNTPPPTPPIQSVGVSVSAPVPVPVLVPVPEVSQVANPAEALVQQWLREAKSIERPSWPAEVSMAQKLINDYGLQQAFEWVRQGTKALERSGMITRTVSFCGLKTVMGRPIVKPTYEEVGWQDNSRRTVSLEPIAADPASTTSSLGIAQVRTGDGPARGVVGAGEGGPAEAKSAEALVLLADTPENTGASDRGAVAGPPVVALSGAWPSSVPDHGGRTLLPPSRSGMPAPSGKVLTLPKCQVPMVFPDGLAVWARLLEQLDAAPAPEASSAIRLANARMERLRLKTRLRALLEGAEPEAGEETSLADAVGRAVAVVPVPVVSERRFAVGG